MAARSYRNQGLWSKHKGECDTANNVQPLAKGAVATFLAAGVLTVG